MDSNTAYSTTLTIDDVAGQNGLTDYEIGALKAAGINPNLLNAEDLKTVKLELPAHSDRLHNIHGAFVADQEGSIEKALDDNKSDTPHNRHESPVETFKNDKAPQASVNDDDDDGDDDDDTPSFKKPAGMIYEGNAVLPLRADKTPNVNANNNAENESTSSAELKPEGWLDDARQRYHIARDKGTERKWVDIIVGEEKDLKPSSRTKLYNFQ